MSDQAIIRQFLDKIKLQLEARLPVATGASVNSLEVVTNVTGGQLLAAPHIGALEYGRGPRVTTTDQGMWVNIQKWLLAKGKPASKEDAVGLTLHINKYGTKQFQSGQGSGVISGVINNKAINSLTNQIASAKTISITSDVLQRFKSIAKIT